MNTGGVNPVPSGVPAAHLNGLAAGIAGIAGRAAREVKTAQEQRRELQGPKRDEVTLGHKAEGESDVDRVDTLDLQSDARGQRQPQGEQQRHEPPHRRAEPASRAADDGTSNVPTSPAAKVPGAEPMRIGRAGIPVGPRTPEQPHIDLAG